MPVLLRKSQHEDDAMTIEQQIAADLNACDLGLALTKGKTRRIYAEHRKACFAAIKEMNKADGLDGMTDDELLAELFS